MPPVWGLGQTATEQRGQPDEMTAFPHVGFSRDGNLTSGAPEAELIVSRQMLVQTWPIGDGGSGGSAPTVARLDVDLQ